MTALIIALVKIMVIFSMFELFQSLSLIDRPSFKSIKVFILIYGAKIVLCAVWLLLLWTFIFKVRLVVGFASKSVPLLSIAPANLWCGTTSIHSLIFFSLKWSFKWLLVERTSDLNIWIQIVESEILGLSLLKVILLTHLLIKLSLSVLLPCWWDIAVGSLTLGNFSSFRRSQFFIQLIIFVALQILYCLQRWTAIVICRVNIVAWHMISWYFITVPLRHHSLRHKVWICLFV